LKNWTRRVLRNDFEISYPDQSGERVRKRTGKSGSGGNVV